MTDLIQILKVTHIFSAILMAWPYYGLVASYQRAQVGPPLGGREDIYFENMVKNRVIPCYVFQGTAFVTGLGLVLLRGLGWEALVSNPMLLLKLLLGAGIAVLLTYVHVNLQPQIDALFAQAGDPVPSDVASRIGALRRRRTRLATVCMSLVLIISMLGVQVWMPFPVWLTALLVVAIVAFTWRAYKTGTPFGWV